MFAQPYARIVGVLYLALGVAGLVPFLLAEEPNLVLRASLLQGRLFGLFPTNIVVSLLHLALGAWGLAWSRDAQRAVSYVTWLAIICLLLAVAGFVGSWRTLFGWAPLYGGTMWLHGLTMFVSALVAWRSARIVGAPRYRHTVD